MKQLLNLATLALLLVIAALANASPAADISKSLVCIFQINQEAPIQLATEITTNYNLGISIPQVLAMPSGEGVLVMANRFNGSVYLTVQTGAFNGPNNGFVPDETSGKVIVGPSVKSEVTSWKGHQIKISCVAPVSF